MEHFRLHKGFPKITSPEVGEVYIFFSIMGESFPLNGFLQQLNHAELERYKLFKTSGKRNEFLFGRLLMKSILALTLDIPAIQLPIAIDAHRRPYLKDHSLQFNLTHSYGGFAFILSKNLEIGIDIEFKKRKISLEEGRHVFMPKERASMASKNTLAGIEEFLFRWTLKEAIYKAANKGTKLLFNEFELELDPLKLQSHSPYLNDKHWELGHTSPHPDYMLSYAIQNPASIPLKIHFQQIEL